MARYARWTPSLTPEPPPSDNESHAASDSDANEMLAIEAIADNLTLQELEDGDDSSMTAEHDVEVVMPDEYEEPANDKPFYESKEPNHDMHAGLNHSGKAMKDGHDIPASGAPAASPVLQGISLPVRGSGKQKRSFDEANLSQADEDVDMDADDEPKERPIKRARRTNSRFPHRVVSGRHPYLTRLATAT